MTSSFTQLRPLPQKRLPVVVGGFVVALALPIFLLANWTIRGWALGAVLWVGSQGLGWLLTRLQSSTTNLAAAGVVAFGMMFRAIAVMAVAFGVALSDKTLGLTAALVYALGYSVELGLSLVTYFGQPAR